MAETLLEKLTKKRSYRFLDFLQQKLDVIWGVFGAPYNKRVLSAYENTKSYLSKWGDSLQNLSFSILKTNKLWPIPIEWRLRNTGLNLMEIIIPKWKKNLYYIQCYIILWFLSICLCVSLFTIFFPKIAWLSFHDILGIPAVLPQSMGMVSFMATPFFVSSILFFWVTWTGLCSVQNFRSIEINQIDSALHLGEESGLILFKDIKALQFVDHHSTSRRWQTYHGYQLNAVLLDDTRINILPTLERNKNKVLDDSQKIADFIGTTLWNPPNQMFFAKTGFLEKPDLL